jgi:glycosyltransferase involved in cell wall biosynthesis
MACALPTLVTGGDHIEWFINESGGGLHVENDPDRIAEVLDDLLDDSTYRDELAERGYEHVVARYTRDGIARRLSDELSSLVDGPDSGASTRQNAGSR